MPAGATETTTIEAMPTPEQLQAQLRARMHEKLSSAFGEAEITAIRHACLHLPGRLVYGTAHGAGTLMRRHGS